MPDIKFSTRIIENRSLKRSHGALNIKNEPKAFGNGERFEQLNEALVNFDGLLERFDQ